MNYRSFDCSFLWFNLSKHQLFLYPISMNKCHSTWLFLPLLVAVGIVCTHRSCGALLAFSTAIIRHLKRICFGGNRDKACMWPPPKPSSAGCPPGGRGLCKLQVRAKRGFGEKPRLAGITCVPARSKQWLLTWFVAFSSPSNAPLTYFLLIPRCDFNWREGGAGRGKGCVCVFLEGGSRCRQGHGVGGELQRAGATKRRGDLGVWMISCCHRCVRATN